MGVITTLGVDVIPNTFMLSLAEAQRGSPRL